MFCAAKLQRKSEYTKFSPYFFYYSNNANKDIISIPTFKYARKYFLRKKYHSLIFRRYQNLIFMI